MSRRPARRTAALVAVGLLALGASPPRGDPSARSSPAPHASEYWDFVASFEAGERLFARFLISNEGPGEASAVAVGHFVHRDGRLVPFRNGRRAGHWTLDAEGRRLRIGSSRLDLSGPGIGFEVDNDKRGTKIHLRMQALPPASAGPELPQTSVDVLALAAPVAGTVWFTGMAEPRAVRGFAGITHTWMDPRESERVLRRLDFFGRDGEVAVYLGEATAPDGSAARVLRVERAGEAIANVTRITISQGEEINGELGPEYPIPNRISVIGDGISGEIHHDQMIVRHEPLQDLPLPFRFLLSSAAHPQRVWMDSRFGVRIEQGSSSQSLLVQGAGVTSVTFTNPLPSKTSKRHATD
jgi:hypothetical protein